MIYKTFIFYCSPAGTTRHVAAVIEQKLAGFGRQVVVCELCNECGICVDLCPVATLTLKPYPVYADNCILCFNCMRGCPENAISSDLSAIHKRVLERAENYQEEPLSEVFTG
ncbi:MAG: hypothetical protein U9Q58_09510 [Pseudomonadota bacterium]|nr:hypothetical protein [Pseudomonadota bacterium]